MRLNLIRCESKSSTTHELQTQRSETSRKSDLINDLREYRQSLKERTPSPEKTFRISSRPISSLYQRSKSILQTIRASDFSPLKEHSSAAVAQEQVSERLRRGGRQFTVESINPLFRLAEIESSSQKRQLIEDLLLKESQECKMYIDSLKNFQNLRFDFELNFELVRGNDFVNCKESPKLGTYYWLEKEMNKVIDGSLSEVFSLNKDNISLFLQQYTQCLRDILRSIKALNGKNEAVLLDMLWKLVIKLFDNALSLHSYYIDLAAETSRESLRKAKREYDRMKEEIMRKSDQIIRKKDEHIKLLEKKIQDLKSTQTYLEHEVIDRDVRLAELTEMGSRNEAVGNFEKLIKKLHKFIGDSENGHEKNISTLKNLADVIHLSETQESSRELKDCGALTEITYSSDEAFRRKGRRNHMYDIIATKEYDILHLRDENVLDICENALDSSNENVPFHRQLLLFLADQMKDPKVLISYTISIKQAVLNAKTFEFCYFKKLLGIEFQLPLAIESYMYKVRKSLIDNEKSPNEIALPELLSVISTLKPEISASLLKKLKPISLNRSGTSLGESSFFTYVERERSLNIGAEKLEFLLCRIALGFSKSSYNIKKVLDELDSNKQGLISVSELISWIVRHLKLNISEEDLDMLKRYFSHGDRAKTTTILDRFNISDYLSIASKLIFSRYEVLYHILEFIEHSYDKLLKDSIILLSSKNKLE
jgi:hypothetical protein